MSDIDRKYVVVYNPETKKLRIGITPTWRFHIDIFGERPEAPWRVWSAGYYTITDDDPATIRTHGKSVGFNIGPKSGDEFMLRAFSSEGEDEFDVDTIRALHRESHAVKS
jgi:hypothetical protein